jgi:hypothetical protein
MKSLAVYIGEASRLAVSFWLVRRVFCRIGKSYWELWNGRRSELVTSEEVESVRNLAVEETTEGLTPEELRTAEAIAGHLRAQRVLKGEFASSEVLLAEVERCYSSPGLECVRDEVTAFARQCQASGEDVVEILVGLFDEVHRQIAVAQERGELVRVGDKWCLNERLTVALNMAQVRLLVVRSES